MGIMVYSLLIMGNAGFVSSTVSFKDGTSEIPSKLPLKGSLISGVPILSC